MFIGALRSTRADAGADRTPGRIELRAGYGLDRRSPLESHTRLTRAPVCVAGWKKVVNLFLEQQQQPIERGVIGNSPSPSLKHDLTPASPTG